MTLTHEWVNKPAVAAAFSRAAHGYEESAAFQRHSGERLLGLLEGRAEGRRPWTWAVAPAILAGV